MPARFPAIHQRNEGFTALPRSMLDRLLCLDLTKRELLVLLLVARLTYGCRGVRWAKVRQADLAAVGIGANHAKQCLQALLARGLLLQNGENPEYRLASAVPPPERDAFTARFEKLQTAVRRHLDEASQNEKEGVPKMGSDVFPNREENTSQKGKFPSLSGWDFNRSRGQFEKIFSPSDRQI